MKRSLAIRFGLILLAIMVFFTFFSGTINYFLTPKVTITMARGGTLNRNLTFNDAELYYENAQTVILPEDIGVTLTAKEVYIGKGDTVTASDVAAILDVSPLEDVLSLLADELVRCEDALHRFDTSFDAERLRLERQLEDDAAALDALVGKNTAVISPGDGLVESVYVKNGDTLTKGMPLAGIADTSLLSVVLPFLSADAALIKKGMLAEITISERSAVLSGTVERVYTGQYSDAFGSIVTDVEIIFDNPGALREGEAAIAVIDGIILSCGAAKMAYKNRFSITADGGGVLQGFDLQPGDAVAAGQLIGHTVSQTSDTQIYRLYEDISRRKLELSYMLEHEILNGQTRRSIENALDDAIKRHGLLTEALEELRELKTGADGFVNDIQLRKEQKLSGGDLLFTILTDESVPYVRQLMTREEAAQISDFAALEYTDGLSARAVSVSVNIESITVSDDPFRAYVVTARLGQSIPYAASIGKLSFALPSPFGIIIPQAALIDGSNVYVVTQSDAFLGMELRVERRSVSLGEAGGGQVIVSDGLSENEYIVTSWDRPIKDGQRVMLPND